jgi:hypothetical protein
MSASAGDEFLARAGFAPKEDVREDVSWVRWGLS